MRTDTVDYTPLREPWSRDQVSRFLAGLRRPEQYAHWHLTRGSLWLTVPALLALTGFWAGLLSIAVSGGGRARWTPGEVVTMGVALAIVLAVYVAIAASIVDASAAGARRVALIRLLDFCRANGFDFVPHASASDFSGRRFEGVFLQDRVTAPDGSFQYGVRTLESGGRLRVGTSLGWYLAVPLERPLPHMVLARRGSGFDRSVHGVRLSLEGDFDRYFDLVVPPGYEHDALYVFTPDLMALLIDHAAHADAEIIDRWAVFYPHFPMKRELWDDESLHRWMRGVVDTVGRKAASRSTNYRDERPGADGARVGVRGRRLRTAAGALVALPIVLATAPMWGLVLDAMLEAFAR